MAEKPVTIPKEPKLEPSQDFAYLRSKGIEFIEQLSSRWWTDYNSHDPGITILEALCYAITDLGYRTGWDIGDLLAEPPGSAATEPCQPFFTARQILTVNPLTADDYRRILIDCDRVSNAWVAPRACACEVTVHADCKEDRLTFRKPEYQTNPDTVSPLGTWNVMLQFEGDSKLGDLNDRKIRHAFTVKSGDRLFTVTAEFRFPEWNSALWGDLSNLVKTDGTLVTPIKSFTFADPVKSASPRLYFVDATIAFTKASVPAVKLEALPIRLFGNASDLQAFPAEWDSGLFDSTELISAVAETFLKKAAAVERKLGEIAGVLQAHRNLCEEFCCLKPVSAEEVSVCADIEVGADTDIERVLASVLFRIERYFNPPVGFHTLQELLGQGVAVENIFEGPILEHGFIRQEELDAATLRRHLRTSDIINELVEIDGVVSVRNLRLTKYDSKGQMVKGVADRGPGSDKNKISAEWTLEISENCLPTLYVDNSAFVFYKNGLPFVAEVSEVQDTLNQLRGETEQLKTVYTQPLDLPVPAGRYRSPDAYSPVQYSLPFIYGTGPEGVREPATEKRRAQARQLKGYLMLFEQLLANAFAQLANARKLFSLDSTLKQSYFVQNLNSEEIIRGVTDILKPALDETRLVEMAETESTMLDRRNRFLDHVMARFGEQFNDYALQFTSYEGKLKGAARTAEDKLSFLKAYPLVSRDRSKGLNHAKDPEAPENQAVLKKRISLLLGLEPDIEEKIIIVEHLLLRPKFPGDALMEVCLGNDCAPCGEADPYSFQLTVVMPGWLPPFDTNIELRRFADRTIRQEIPAHLLGKICWVGNLDYGTGLDKNLIQALATLIRNDGRTAANAHPTVRSALKGAGNLYDAAIAAFTGWMESNVYLGLDEPGVETALDKLFRKKLDPMSDIYSGISNYGLIGDSVFEMLTGHFAAIVKGDQWHIYDRFEKAWKAWLEELSASPFRNGCNGDFARLIEPLLAGMIGHWLDPHEAAAQAVAEFGSLFADKMKQTARSGADLEDTDKAVADIFDLAVTAAPFNSPSLSVKEKNTLKKLFVSLYGPRVRESLALWDVVTMLSKLRSVYPQATLHDCQDGNDRNPVRLDSTMLGE
ncbi:MAG: hypothetical protein HGB00_05725 [Chlorobiaceae bacterium]|nr:hypothetical protein [Chlorobiaceae bacterium]